MGLARRFFPDFALAAEEDRWPLWLPVALGLGDAAYFALWAEPQVWGAWAAAGLALAATGAAFALRGAGTRMLLAVLAMLALGFALGKFREMRVAAPVLAHRAVMHLTGRVEWAEVRDRGVRIVLTDLKSGAFGKRVPARARIAFVRNDALLRPGAWIGATANLMPPPSPVAPGAADFGRADYFARLGAVGFAFGEAQPSVAARELRWNEKIAAGVEDLRWRMTARIQAALPGSIGAIASALITGARGGISDEDEAALRDAGLAHVLAIAGLHMALVGGGLFWLVRAGLAAFPSLALQYPIKKWAAAAALAMSAFYLVISGAAPPAVRAFVMLGCALLAVLMDRPALSMRSLALAAAILLILRPETITEPGFQMSFAAVGGLVAVAEWEATRKARRGPLWRYVHGIAMTSLVASIATLPYAMFHFGRMTHYAVLGNLLAMPVMGFAVMPLAALSVMAMPLGLEAGPLHLLGRSIEAMLALGRMVSGLPGAVSDVAAMPVTALVLLSLGGLWCALWRRPWRWLGLAPLLAGVAATLLARPPDVLIAPDGLTVALRGTDGLLRFVGKPKDRFAARGWMDRNGQNDAVMPAADARCDGVGCVAVARDGVVVAVGRRLEAAADDCAHAGIVVGAADRLNCPDAKLAAGQAQLRWAQGYAVRLDPLRVTSVRQARGARPWTDQ